jgi:hypothetical protein
MLRGRSRKVTDVFEKTTAALCRADNRSDAICEFADGEESTTLHPAQDGSSKSNM